MPAVRLQTQEQVIRLDVTVHDAERVCIFERSEQLAREVERFQDWELFALVELLLERATAQILGHEKRTTVQKLPMALDGDDVRTVEELRQRFSLETQPVEDRSMMHELDPRHLRHKALTHAAVCDQEDISH